MAAAIAMARAVAPALRAAECGSRRRTPDSSHASSPASSFAAPLGTPAYCTRVGVVLHASWDGTTFGRRSTVFSGARASSIIIASLDVRHLGHAASRTRQTHIHAGMLF